MTIRLCPGAGLKEAAAKAASLRMARSSDLLKLCRDTAETRVQLGADAVYSGDDRHGDARGDQTIFDGRRPRLIFPKPSDKLRHEISSFAPNKPTVRGGS